MSLVYTSADWGRVENGYIIALPYSDRTSCLPCKPLSARIILEERTKSKLKAGKFKVTVDAVQEAIDIVNHYQIRGWLSRNSICSTLCLSCCSCVFTLLVFFLLWGILGVTVYFQQNLHRTAGTQVRYQTALWITPFVVMGVVCFGLMMHRSRKMTKEMQHLMEDLYNKLTLNTFEDGVIFRVVSNFDKASRDLVQILELSLIRYDVQPCKKYMAEKMKKMEDTNDEDLAKSIEEYETMANNLLKHHLRWLIYYNAPDAPETRHPVKGGKACFCQILETENLIK